AACVRSGSAKVPGYGRRRSRREWRPGRGRMPAGTRHGFRAPRCCATPGLLRSVSPAANSWPEFRLGMNLPYPCSKTNVSSEGHYAHVTDLRLIARSLAVAKLSRFGHACETHRHGTVT